MFFLPSLPPSTFGNRAKEEVHCSSLVLRRGHTNNDFYPKKEKGRVPLCEKNRRHKVASDDINNREAYISAFKFYSDSATRQNKCKEKCLTVPLHLSKEIFSDMSSPQKRQLLSPTLWTVRYTTTSPRPALPCPRTAVGKQYA